MFQVDGEDGRLPYYCTQGNTGPSDQILATYLYVYS